MVRAIYILIIPLLLCQQTHAQTLSEKIDEYLETESKKLNIPNVSITVFDKQSVLYSNIWGDDHNHSKSFYIGSVSKSLTAFAILKLIDKEQINLDKEVTEIIPNLKLSNSTSAVTIRQLLNHTSGISKKSGFKELPTLNELEEKKFVVKLKNVPGALYEYSNLNYSILGLVIEKLSGKSYQEFMQEEVFMPFKMLTASAKAREESNTIQQYQYWGVPIPSKQRNYDKTAIPAGFISCSAQDLGNYLMMNLNSGRFNSQVLLSSDLLNEMHTPWNRSEYGYAMGWKQGKFNNRRILQHLGSTPTSTSGIFVFPDDNIGLVLLTNSNSMWFSEELMEGILNIITNNEPQPTSKFERYFRYVLILLILIILGQMIYKIMIAIKMKQKWDQKKEIGKMAVQITITILLFVAFPLIAKIPFWDFVKFQPDIGFLILLASIAPIPITFLRLFIIKKLK